MTLHVWPAHKLVHPCQERLESTLVKFMRSVLRLTLQNGALLTVLKQEKAQKRYLAETDVRFFGSPWLTWELRGNKFSKISI